MTSFTYYLLLTSFTCYQLLRIILVWTPMGNEFVPIFSTYDDQAAVSQFWIDGHSEEEAICLFEGKRRTSISHESLRRNPGYNSVKINSLQEIEMRIIIAPSRNSVWCQVFCQDQKGLLKVCLGKRHGILILSNLGDNLSWILSCKGSFVLTYVLKPKICWWDQDVLFVVHLIITITIYYMDVCVLEGYFQNLFGRRLPKSERMILWHLGLAFQIAD